MRRGANFLGKSRVIQSFFITFCSNCRVLADGIISIQSFKINSDLDSADFQSSKFIAKLSTDVATSALLVLNKIVLEVNSRGLSFEVNQSAIDFSAIF